MKTFSLFFCLFMLTILQNTYSAYWITSCQPKVIEKSSSNVNIKHVCTFTDDSFFPTKYYFAAFGSNSSSDELVAETSIVTTNREASKDYSLSLGDRTFIVLQNRVICHLEGGADFEPAWTSLKVYIGTKPANLSGIVTGSDVNISWSKSYGTVEKYNIYVNNVLVGDVPNTASTYTSYSLNIGNNTIKVSSVYPDGNELISSGLVVNIPDTQSPTAPSNLRVVSQTQTTCNLAWNASTDNVGVQGYKIYKNEVLIATLSGTTLTYTASISNDVSSFKVIAFDAAGNVSTASNTINVDGTPPTAPVANTATSVNSSSFVVNWTPVTGATGYVLDISTASNFSTFVYTYNNASTTQFTGNPNSSVAIYGMIYPGTTYYYRIRAVKNTLQSANSNVVTILTLPLAPQANAATNVTPTSFTANWNSVSGTVSNYRLDVSTSSSFASYVSGYQNLSVSGTSKSITGLSSSYTYYYRVRAANSTGSSTNSNIITTAYITAPVANAATSVNSSSFVVNWTPVTGATGYVLDISTASNFSTFVYTYNNASTTQFTGNPNSSVAIYGMIYPGTTYYYRIRAVKNTSQSANSNVISVTTMAAGQINPQASKKSATMEKPLNIADIKFTIYPNPVDEVLNIELKDIKEKVNLNIYNSSGILIKSLILSNTFNDIDVSNFPKGMYLITENGTVINKFIKE
ncbi:MAG TPA: hypothetical protein DCQ26_01865 [Marinilabiliales bacterium]|nr:hypothetical protein [Marinilabiliales bacterium]